MSVRVSDYNGALPHAASSARAVRVGEKVVVVAAQAVTTESVRCSARLARCGHLGLYVVQDEMRCQR